LLLLASAWGAALSFAVVRGRLPEPWARRSLAEAPTAVPADRNGCDCTQAAAGTALGASAAGPAAGALAGAAPLARFVVCGREEAPPALAELRDLASTPRLAVDCGSSLHLIAVEELADGLQPQRVALLTARSTSPAEALRAVAPIAADLDGDTRSDLLVPVLLVDAQGSPRGGALQRLRARPEGGFDPPVRAIELAPGAVAAGRFDGEAGADLALIQLGDARLDRDSELWTVHGGPSPLRSSTRNAGVGASALVTIDLDRDGFDDVVVASESEGKVRLFLAHDGDSAQPTVWELPAVREALSADLDGDSARDLVLIGARIWVVLAHAGQALVPRELAASDGLRDVQALDLDHDGKLDLAGYVHPSLVALLQTESGTAPALRGGPSVALGFERRTLATLEGDAAVFAARIAQLGGSDAPDAWITTLSNGSEPAVEISLARDLAFGAHVALGSSTRPLPDAPLIEHFALR
jgi:hypothetical protein